MEVGLNEENYPDWLTSAISAAVVWGIELLLCIKSHLLFFQQKYHDSILNETWNKDINSSWSDWFIRNKNKCGSFKYVVKFLIIPYIILIIVAALGEPVFGMFCYVNFAQVQK